MPEETINRIPDEGLKVWVIANEGSEESVSQSRSLNASEPLEGRIRGAGGGDHRTQYPFRKSDGGKEGR